MAIPGGPFGAPPISGGPIPPLMASLPPAPMIPPPPPPEVEMARAKFIEASKAALDAIAMLQKAGPPYAMLAEPAQAGIELFTKLSGQLAKPVGGPPRLPTPDGTPGPMLDREPTGGVGIGNPQAVLGTMLQR